jgi:ferritin
LRKGIAEHIVGCASNNAPNRFLFRKAQEEVFHMMKMDSFVMFQKSKEVSSVLRLDFVQYDPC